ncbi:hypothetical protein [Methylocystis sp. S23]
MTETSARHEGSLAKALFRALFGPILWAVHFSLLYAIHTVLCVIDIRPPDRAGATLAASTLLTIGALALLAGFFVARWRSASRQRSQAERIAETFLDDMSTLLIVLSAGGVLWAGAAAGFINACEPLR